MAPKNPIEHVVIKEASILVNFSYLRQFLFRGVGGGGSLFVRRQR